MDSKIDFGMSLIVVEAIRGRCASFMILTATVSEIFGGQTNSTYFSSIDNIASSPWRQLLQHMKANDGQCLNLVSFSATN